MESYFHHHIPHTLAILSNPHKMVSSNGQSVSKQDHIDSNEFQYTSNKIINIENGNRSIHHIKSYFHHHILQIPELKNRHILCDKDYPISHILEYYIHNKFHIYMMCKVLDIEISIQNIHQRENYFNLHMFLSHLLFRLRNLINISQSILVESIHANTKNINQNHI